MTTPLTHQLFMCGADLQGEGMENTIPTSEKHPTQRLLWYASVAEKRDTFELNAMLRPVTTAEGKDI